MAESLDGRRAENATEGVFFEGHRILTDGARYRCIGEYTGAVLFESDDLDAVVRRALDATSGHRPSLTFGPGEFSLGAPLQLTDGARVAGSGAAVTKLRCDAAAPVDAVIVCDRVRDVSICDLTVTSGGEDTVETGVVVRSSVGVSLRTISAVGFRGHGIRIADNSRFCRIVDCTIAGNGIANVVFENLAGEPDGDFGVNLISGCMIYGGGAGIACRRALTVNIANCIVNQTSEPAFLLTDKSNSVLITGCRSFQIDADAVHVSESHELTIAGNIFCWHAGHGIASSNSNWATISGNEIIDSGNVNPGTPDLTTRFDELPVPPEPHDGIRLVGVTGYNVTGNTIFNWGVVPKLAAGVSEDASSSHNVITGNNVNYYESGPVVASGTGTVEGHNVGYPAAPHQDQPIAPAGTLLQSFVPELRRAEIADLL